MYLAGFTMILLPSARMSTKTPGQWIFRGISRDLMQRVKIAAAIEGRTVKDMVISLVENHLKELERKGLLPKGKG